MHADIVYSATYPHPPEQVWSLLTRPEWLEAWLMKNTLSSAEVGHRFRFTDRPRPFWDGISECEVVASEPGRRFALRWGINARNEATEVSWTLTPDGPSGNGTHLEFRHSGLRGFMGWIMKKGMTRGWQRMIERSIPYILDELAAGRTPDRDAVRCASLGRAS